MKVYFIGEKKNGKILLAKIPSKNLLGFSLDDSEIDWQKVKKSDCIWYFGSEELLKQQCDNFIATKKPMIVSLSYRSLPEELESKLSKYSTTWIYGPRICLGMNLLAPFLEFLKNGHTFWNNIQTEILDICASDEDSGPHPLAKDWAQIVDPKAQILSDRISSHPGAASLNLSTENEELQLSHRVKNQDAYIQGAFWATYKILFSAHSLSGLVKFELLFWKNQLAGNIMESEYRP